MTTRSIPRPMEVSEVWLWPNLLSLQAPIVAVLWQVLLARSLRVSLDPFAPWALGMAVWLIYVADHLVDTARPPAPTGEPVRKEFCRRHWDKFVVATILVGLGLALGVGRFMWATTFQMGAPIAMGVGCYFALVHLLPAGWRSLWPREVVVATIFTLGTFGAVWLAAGERSQELWAPALAFMVLCLTNCCVIETWEWEQSPNLAARWVSSHLLLVTLTTAAGAGLLGWAGLMPEAFAAAVILSGVALALLAICRHAVPIRFVSPLADLALCSPLLILLVKSRT